mmetsp:Transcript_18487/g.60466  ORF Transcript_18487/g.60466 Transcript_18487/m.60466 type:complete len:233 (+) Transcript_18487:963-1661(+)
MNVMMPSAESTGRPVTRRWTANRWRSSRLSSPPPDWASRVAWRPSSTCRRTTGSGSSSPGFPDGSLRRTWIWRASGAYLRTAAVLRIDQRTERKPVLLEAGVNSCVCVTGEGRRRRERRPAKRTTQYKTARPIMILAAKSSSASALPMYSNSSHVFARMLRGGAGGDAGGDGGAGGGGDEGGVGGVGGGGEGGGGSGEGHSVRPNGTSSDEPSHTPSLSAQRRVVLSTWVTS